VNANRCQERKAMQWGGCGALPRHRPSAPPQEGIAGLGQEGKTSFYLQLRILKSLEKHHAHGNLLLSRAHYLKPSTAHPAAELGGEPIPSWGRQTLHGS